MFIGSVVHRDEDAYEETRRRMSWNAMTPDGLPELIVTAASEDDVIEAVRLARSRGLKIAIRGGGHSLCGSSFRDGALLIDLSQLDELSIDPDSRTATVQPGITGGAFADALAEHGLGFPVGHCGSVPMSGYLLCGGFGWNMGAWGPACFSVSQVDVVTAEGELVSADANRNAELFWAARGAGPGFFGIATRFHVRLYPLPKVIRSTTQLYPFSELGEVASWAAGLRRSLPQSVEMFLFLVSPPPAAGAPPGARVVGVSAAAFVDSEAEAASCLSPLEECPAIDRALWRQTNEPTSIAGLQAMIGQFLPEGLRFASDAVWSGEAPERLLPSLADRVANAPSPRSLVISPMVTAPPGGALPDAAFSMVGRSFFLCYAVWSEAADDEANIEWLRQTSRDLEPFSSGYYVAEADLPADRSRSSRAFAPANWERLQSLREANDPNGMFHSFLVPDDERSTDGH
jgi:FAD/FMN-containing dehydrogenase